MGSDGLHTSWEDLNKARLWVLMPIGSLTVRAIFYPITLIKTRLQASEVYRGTLHAFRSILRDEGVSALYKGFSVSLLGLFIGPIYISTLEASKSLLISWAPDDSASQMAVPMLSGACASAIGQTLSVPLDIVSQRRMMQTSDGKATSAVSICQLLWKEGGVVSFYRGYAISLLTYVPSSSIVWGTVHLVLPPLSSLWPRDLSRGPVEPGTAPARWEGAMRDVSLCMLSGSIAGATSAILLAPLDVIRTRMQVLDVQPGQESRRGIIGTARTLMKERGLRGFGAGVTARIATLAPLFAVIIGGYEVIKRACAKEALQRELTTSLPARK